MKSEYAVPLWHDEHARFLRLLYFLDNEMMCFHEGGHPNYDLMRDIIYYWQHYANHYHHPRETVEAATATYLVHCRSHIRTEELEILAQAISLLQEEDWTQVAAAVPTAPEPLFGNDISGRYRDLRIQIVREKVLTHQG